MICSEFLQFLSAFEGTGEGDVIGVFKFGAEGQSLGKACDSNTEVGYHVVQVHGGLLSFKVGIGCHDYLFHVVCSEPFKQFSYADILGAHPLGGRYSAMENVVESFIYPGMLKRQDILWLFHDAYLGTVAVKTVAYPARIGVGYVETG